jgi:hypothetical protein
VSLVATLLVLPVLYATVHRRRSAQHDLRMVADRDLLSIAEQEVVR